MAGGIPGVVILLLALYGLLAVGAHFLSGWMLYPRPPLKYADDANVIWLTAPDGTRLAARHWPNPSARFTLLFLHGNYEDLGSIAEYIPAFVDAGYAVFAYDFRRYGLSAGTPTEANLCGDTEVAYRHLREVLGISPQNLVAFGYSLGGGPAIELALRFPLAGVVLQGAFVSAYRVKSGIPLFPGDKFRNLAKIGRVTCPVMVIHGSEDRTVPYWHGQALFRAVRSRKESFFVPGGPHTKLAAFAGPGYWDALKRFTDSL